MSSGRPPNILRPVKLTTYLPEDLRAKLDLHLYSSIEGRVPHGAYAKFFEELTREFFEKEHKVLASTVVSAESSQPDIKQFLTLSGFATEIALTDLRSGWSSERVTAVVHRAREITGKVPR